MVWFLMLITLMPNNLNARLAIVSGQHFLAAWLLLNFIFTALPSSAQLFNQDSLKLVSRDFSFTEGPAVNKKGDIYFTDQPNNKIWKYDISGHLSLFTADAGRANGLYFDRKGRLIACADDHNELWSFSKSGKAKVLLTNFEGRKLNGPNDLWVDAKGGIYFTDPYYQRDYWTRQQPEITEQKVYYLPSGKHAAVRVVADNVSKPNGIVGSPDGKYLFVADIQRGKTYRYDVAANGSLSKQKELIGRGADGITLDEKGNIYLTGNGVFIYSPAGELIGHIEVKEPWTANVCFGGKDRSTLFITASTAIYTLPMKVKGVE